MALQRFAKRWNDVENIHHEDDEDRGGRLYEDIKPKKTRSESGPAKEDRFFYQKPKKETSQHDSWRFSHGKEGYEERKDRDLDYGVKEYLGTYKKGQRETFFCNICFVELSSREVKFSHQEGVKHRLKLEQKRISDPHRVIVQIPNPAGIKKNPPIRLYQKIQKYPDPVVGLKFVEEFICLSNEELEPRYECSLCGSVGDTNAMLSHVLGKKHRQKFFEKKYRGREISSKYMLAKMAKDYAENEKTYRIRTHRSDARYPWPAGKAPWSIEQGGNGIAPVGLRGTVVTSSGKVSLPEIETMGEVNEGTLEMFVDYAAEVAEKISSFNRKSRCVDKDLTDNILRNMYDLQTETRNMLARINRGPICF